MLSSRTDSLTWELEYGLGNDPREWVAVDTGSETQAVDGVITTLDLSTIPLADAIREATIDETIVQRLERVNQPAVTLRLKATMPMAMKEMRKTFYLQVDPDLKLAFLLKCLGLEKPLRLWWIWMVMVFLNSSWQMVLGVSTC